MQGTAELKPEISRPELGTLSASPSFSPSLRDGAKGREMAAAGRETVAAAWREAAVAVSAVAGRVRESVAAVPGRAVEALAASSAGGGLPLRVPLTTATKGLAASDGNPAEEAVAEAPLKGEFLGAGIRRKGLLEFERMGC